MEEKNKYEIVAEHITGMWLIVNTLFQGVWDFLDRGHIIRRLCLGAMWYLTFKAVFFIFYAAEQSNYAYEVIGASIGLLTPLAGLQGFVQKFYNDSKKHAIEAKKLQLIELKLKKAKSFEAVNDVEIPGLELSEEMSA